MNQKLSHIDDKGQASMVDVSEKDDTSRVAVAKGTIRMRPNTFDMIMADEVPKGNVLGTARIAGIMAAKRTPDLIPLCHPLPLAKVSIEFEPAKDKTGFDIVATAKVIGKTGVEMEALTAVSVAALTIYDMAKAVDREMLISDLRLIHKSGGKSGTFDADA